MAPSCPTQSPWETAGLAKGHAYRREEDPTDKGPADYTLCDGTCRLAVVEAKKPSTDPQEVLTQAERYAKGACATSSSSPWRIPPSYSCNGNDLWFRDVRDVGNLQRRLRAFHTPGGLRELLDHNIADKLADHIADPYTHPKLRDYQRRANEAIEEAIVARKRRLLVAMATGTGKTFTMVHLLARLLQAGVVRRVLFLVDRHALAVQALRAFRFFEIPGRGKFHQNYEVLNQAAGPVDDDGDAFDVEKLLREDLENPKPHAAFVYVSTIQGLARKLLGKNLGSGSEGDEDAVDDDEGRIDMPIHTFDLVIADECHRGYTGQELSVWSETLQHFDAVQIGLTATPAAHTTLHFGKPIFTYDVKTAVREKVLVDYDVVKVRSDVRVHGLFLKEGETIERLKSSGAFQLDLLEDQRAFDSPDVQRERLVTSPDSNRKIALEVKKYADEHEARTGRFPKTLVFAAHDIAGISHADQLVTVFREILHDVDKGRGNDFVCKITGSPSVDRPLKRIKEFRNRKEPGVVVTVDMLSTGVDIPDLENIVLVRAVRSRILFEQILGRGTRRGEHHPDKSHFTVFDCFDGTLLAYFKGATDITAEEPAAPTRTLDEIVEAVWENQDREWNEGLLVKRLLRIDKAMDGSWRAVLAGHGVVDGDLAAYAKALPNKLASDFVGTMTFLRRPGLLRDLRDYRRPKPTFVRAISTVDTVTSEWLIRGDDGEDYKPEDHLSAFSRFVVEKREELMALTILTGVDKRRWKAGVLVELKKALAQAAPGFTPEQLERASRATHKKELVELLSLVQRAADAQHPLYTAEERVAVAFAKLVTGRTFTTEQQQWIDRIRPHLIANLAVDVDDFDLLPAFVQLGGLGRARGVFGDAAQLDELLTDINAAVAGA
ncbi:MAG: DEAD/DEAH box helicase family protein [Deltaproteobacteria bacterium]|nr:DEAD/DEAH box helicase family protein [Deltaproteobacteria bacterium]